MDEPEYQEYKSASFPVVEKSDYRVKVIIGHFGEAMSTIEDEITNVFYIDVKVEPDKEFKHTLPSTNNSFLYVFEGNCQVNAQSVSKNTLITLGDAQTSSVFVAGEKGGAIRAY